MPQWRDLAAGLRPPDREPEEHEPGGIRRTANPGEVQQTVMEWHSQKLDGSRNEPTLNSLDLVPGHNSWSLPLRWVAGGVRKQRSSFACLPEHVPGRNRDSCSVVWSKRGDYGGTQSSRALLHGLLLHLCWVCGVGVGRTGKCHPPMRSSATTP